MPKKMPKKKEAILKAATVLFANKGFTDTSMHELSELTGAAEGTIFYHFKNKEHLLLTILQTTNESIVEEFDRFIDGREFKNGLHMVEEIVSFYLYLAGIMEFQFLLLQRHYLYKFVAENQDFRSSLEEFYNCISDMFEKAIVRGQQDGSIGNVHPRKTALILFTMVDGVVRFKNFNLYDAGALFNDLIESCRKMLKPDGETAR
ncbi:TetR/AcrR family transcriptional regulator [Salidesulfovibrio brasiliensis]|uniref:TetR/AcrR family transcriptional regulator n=1 Tax=Salidesulfovibrio brasiliensis TaxID=221711 RepID=UPI0006CFBA88|nr:TetR/AcrR family transcriptional regulator [Salidesulfovibrio brasiliensis]